MVLPFQMPSSCFSVVVPFLALFPFLFVRYVYTHIYILVVVLVCGRCEFWRTFM